MQIVCVLDQVCRPDDLSMELGEELEKELGKDWKTAKGLADEEICKLRNEAAPFSGRATSARLQAVESLETRREAAKWSRC